MFAFREGTLDLIIYHQVTYYNEYRLPFAFATSDVVVDIGAHIGSFSYAVLQRGAGKVYAIEADIDNYRLAANNLRPFIENGRLVLIYGAVWRSDTNDDILYYDGYDMLNDCVNTGSGGVLFNKVGGSPVPKIAFDELIRQIELVEQRDISLLKLDCEGSEWPILLTSNELHYIDSICGEFHEIGGAYDTLTVPFEINGYQRYTVETLECFLRDHHFQVTACRNFPGGVPERLGLFFATRSRRV